MKTVIFYLIGISLFVLSCNGQSSRRMQDYIGKWKGKEVNSGDLNLKIVIEQQGESGIFSISNSKEILTKEINLEKYIKVKLGSDLTFLCLFNKEQSEISGFMRMKRDLFPVLFKKKGTQYVGTLDLSVLPYLQTGHLRLKIEGVTNEKYSAYPMLGSLWCSDFQKRENQISFNDYETGLGFEGQLGQAQILLDIKLGGQVITTVLYQRSIENKKSDTTLQHTKDEFKTSFKHIELMTMEQDIQSGILEGTEGVLISKNQEIIYENYFGGFNANIPHDTRSAGKSVGSGVIGLAIDHGIIESVNQRIYGHMPEEFSYTTDSMKAEITIQDLLTMRSGIGVSEDDYQESNNWLKTVLEAPLAYVPGERTYYKSADPFLAGIYLNERLDIPLEFFIEENLLSPLGITNYIMNTDDHGVPYFGGGIQLTPRDMLKIGQLYLNKGVRNGKQVLSESWVVDSFKKHTSLENVSDKNNYGYFWWHNSYYVAEKEFKSVEARGAGGQYIFILPELSAVIVITSGNYRNGKTRQPEEIVEKYILPLISSTK